MQNDIDQLRRTLIIRFIVLLITGFLSFLLSFINDNAIPVAEFLDRTKQPMTYLFIQSVLGIVAIFSGYTVLSCGITKLLKFQADADSICAVGLIASVASTVLLMINTSPVQHGKAFIFVPVAIAGMLANTIGKLLIVGRAQRNFKFLSSDTEKYSVFNIEDESTAAVFTKGALRDFPVLASMKKTEFLTGFIKSTYCGDATDKFCKIAMPIILGMSLISAVICTFVTKEFGSDRFYIALANFTACLSMASCFGIMLTVNLPLASSGKKYLESSGVLLGYESVEEFADTNSVLLDVTQLFPQGVISLSAIKVFSDTRIDEAIVEAASLSSQANSILKNMFFDIIAGKTELLNPVESYIYEDTMGLCGWINNKRVLLGNRELMANHSIAGVPTKTKEKEYTKNGKQVIYLSVSGELSAMFVIELSPSLEVKRWLKLLEKQGVHVMLRSVDSVISLTKLSELFEVSPEMFKLIPFRLHNAFEEQTEYVPRASGAVACSGKFTSFAQLIVGAKRVHKTVTLGLALQAAAAILGVLLTIILTITGAFGMMTSSMVLLYNLIWMGITAAIQMARPS